MFGSFFPLILEAREQRICGMGKERREKIALKGKMLNKPQRLSQT